MGGESAECADRRQNRRHPFRRYDGKELYARQKHREHNKNPEMQRGRASNTSSLVQPPDGKDNSRQKQKHQIQGEVFSSPEITLHFASKDKQDVHFDREPKKRGPTSRMNQCVG